MSIRFYLDEHVPKAVAKGLRQRGVDVLTVAEAKMIGASDDEHLARARQEERAIFTQDVDFLRLAARGTAHAGIVYAPQVTPITRILAGLMLIHQVLEPHEMQGHIEYLS